MENLSLIRNAARLIAASLALGAAMALAAGAFAETEAVTGTETGAETGAAEPGETAGKTFTLGRFLTCQRVVDREPVGVTDTFDEDTVKVYVFLEALEVSEPTPVKIRWLFHGKETALIDLELGKSSRWRTFSSKRIGTRRGPWEVRLLDSQDRIIRSLSFTVK